MDEKTITIPYTEIVLSEYVLLSVAFLIPFFISGPQLLTGTIVNMLLYLYVMRFYNKRTLLLVVAPSIGALLNGILLGKFTMFLLYLLPFIWIGNYALLQVFRTLQNRYGIVNSLVISSLVKCGILFGFALLLVGIKVIPAIFLQMMGLFQLYTALMGGGAAYIIHKIISKKP